MNCKNLILAALAGFLALACSTTRAIPEGKYRLVENKIKVDGKAVRSSELASYLTQKPNTTILGYAPGVALYNMADTAQTWWNNLIRSLGSAPVIYDERHVDASIDNIESHLEYIGFYGSKVHSEVEYKKKRAYVTYFVHPGAQYKIRSIEYVLPEDSLFRREFDTDLRRTTIKE